MLVILNWSFISFPKGQPISLTVPLPTTWPPDTIGWAAETAGPTPKSPVYCLQMILYDPKQPESIMEQKALRSAGKKQVS